MSEAGPSWYRTAPSSSGNRELFGKRRNEIEETNENDADEKRIRMMDEVLKSTQAAIQTLHESINYGDENEVKEFIEEFPDEKLAYNKKNVTAVAVALKLNRWKIYEILITVGFWLGPFEEFDDIVKDFSDSDKRKIFEIHQRCAINPKQKHLLVLNSKCKLFHTTPVRKRNEFLGRIAKALREMNEISFIEPLLKVAACCEKLTFIFDFDRDSVEKIDPRKHDEVRGVTYLKSSCITLGAKGLCCDFARFGVNGTFAHELCHLVNDLVFDNDCKPYTKGNEAMQEKFEKIVGHCKKNKSAEEIIARVFDCSPQERWHAELIVRVVQIIAFYANNPEKFMEVRFNFSELFDFFIEYVLPEIERNLPLIEAKVRVKDLNERFGVLWTLKNAEISLKSEIVATLNFNLNTKQITKIPSNCVSLTMTSIYQQLEMQGKLSTHVFVTLERLKNEDDREVLAKTFKMKSELSLIIECGRQEVVEAKKISERFKEIGGKLNFVCCEELKMQNETAKKKSMNHSWTELTEESQQKLLLISTKFQGIETKLMEICKRSSKAIKAIPLTALVAKKEIKIGKVLEEVKIHAERKFLTTNTKWDRWTQKYDQKLSTFDDVIKIVRQEKVFLLSDEPGNGKSTELKMTANKLKQKFPSSWVEYFDLKQFTKVFEENKKIKFDNGEEIAKFLAEKLLKLESFEAKVFVELFGDGRVIIFMDGVDEISPSYNKLVMNLLIAIREKSVNQLWIATRPHLAMDLEGKLKTKAMKLEKFSEENRRKFFEQILTAKEVGSLKIKEILFVTENFLTTLKSSESFSNPMLLRMIAELFEDDLNFQLADAHLYSVYDTFVEKSIDRLHEKGWVAYNDIKHKGAQPMIECYQKKAVEVMLGNDADRYKDSDDDKESKIPSVFKNTPDLPVHKLVRIPLVFDNGTGELHFVHRTFGEFFIAKFLIEKTLEQINESAEESEALAELWMEVLRMSDLQMIRKFLESKIGEIEIDAQENSSRNVFEIIKKGSSDILLRLSDEGCINLIKFVSCEMIERENLVANWTYCVGEYSVLSLAVRLQHFEFVCELWEFAAETFEPEEVKDILLHENRAGENILNCAVDYESDANIFEFFVDHARFGILNNVELERFLAPKYPLWDSKNMEMTTIIDRCKKKFNENEFKRFLASTNDDRGWSLLQRAFSETDSESVQIILDEFVNNFDVSTTKEFALKRTRWRNRTSLMLAGENKNEKVFNIIWDFINGEEHDEMLTEEDNSGWNVFVWATRNANAENFEMIKNIYERKSFGEKIVKEILTKKNYLNFGSCVNILHIAIEASHNEKTVEALWKFMHEKLDDETLMDLLIQDYSECDSVFQRTDSPTKLEIFEPFILKTCTNSTSRETLSVWFFVAKFFRVEFVQKLFEIVDQDSDFAALFYPALFEFRDEKGKKILPYARDTWETEEVYELLLMKAENHLSPEQVEAIYLVDSSDDQTK